MEYKLLLKVLNVVVCLTGLLCRDIMAVEPSFDVPVVNITVVAGQTATLPCTVNSLGKHKVVWTDQFSTLLTLDTKRIIDDDRMVIDRPHTGDWNLLLHDVKYEDRGLYTCQINTMPIKTKTIQLIVLVPPEILETSSHDMTTREGETVTLTCNVSGVPRPTVQWFRTPLQGHGAHRKTRVKTTVTFHHHIGNQFSADHKCLYTVSHRVYDIEMTSAPIVIGQTPVVNNGVGMSGEILVIHNISRHCDGIYECVAFNDVPPAVNRDIKVQVEFPPEIRLDNKRLGQSIGKETILECKITAFPQAEVVWLFREKDLVHSPKHDVHIYKDSDSGHEVTLSLRVKNVTREDYGLYTCFASNAFGEDEETMLLYDFSPLTKPKTTTTTTTTTERPFTHKPHKPVGNPWQTEYIDYGNDNESKDPAGVLNPGNTQFQTGSPRNNGIICSGAILYICEPYTMGRNNGQHTNNLDNLLRNILITLLISIQYILTYL